ncbi:hypothetical protein [Mucilaginibacter sp. BT774]|uniref:hypothetical protein n=1 Tax=Mucilaginibacter sp. BT774 TaxID=3062276 RepID=UPI00267605E3|nr:hypothetical protein [Mucilaginibacter sp. BT774]MDO3627242.1 hypothetical protein [Mucilaginibacter sp. BT774]
MYSEAKETARLYKLLSEKLGSDTAEAMFKYIDNRTERSVEATIKTLATKDDIASIRAEIVDTKEEIANLRYDIRKEIGEHKADSIKWMFIFWVGQISATLAFILLFVKK